jgi:hypothetical protein
MTTHKHEAVEHLSAQFPIDDDPDLLHDGLSRATAGFKGLERNMHVFWVSAATKEKFLESYRTIHTCIFPAVALSLEPHVFMSEVQMWLEDPRNGPWLLILDDAQPHVFRQDEGICSKYIPGTSSKAAGCIFITSVSNFFDTMFNLHSRESLSMQGLEKEAARGLFLTILNSNIGQDAAVERVVSALDMLPSAIISASSYCRMGLVSPKNYHRRWKNCPRLRLDGLSFIYGSDFEKQALPSLITAWQMTFKMIEEVSPCAITLLQTLLCLCAEDLHSGLLGDEFKGEHYSVLVEYGVLRRRQRCSKGRADRYDVDHYTMLRHVQIIGQTWLWANDKERYTEAHMRVLDILAQRVKEFDASSHRQTSYQMTLRKRRELLPHLEFFLMYCQQTAAGKLGLLAKPITGDQTEVITSLANLYSVEGLFTEATHMLEFAYRTHHDQDLNRVRCLIGLAAALRNNYLAFPRTNARTLKKATDMLNEAQGICHPPHSDPTTRDDVSDEIRTRLGVEIEEGMAMTMCERMNESAHSPDPQLHTRVAEFFQNALFHQERVLILNRKLFGEDSGEFLQSKLQRARIAYNMAKLVRKDSDHSDDHDCDEDSSASGNTPRTRETRREAMLLSAAKEQDVVIQSWQQRPYKPDSDTLLRLHAAQAALARTLYALDKVSEAEGWLKKSYDGRRALLGKDAVKTLTTGQDLAMCMLLRDINEAERFWRGTLESITNRYGSDHPVVQSAKLKWDRQLETLRCNTPIDSTPITACDFRDTASVSTLHLPE